LYDQLIEKARVEELAGEIASANYPHVRATCLGGHLRMHDANVSLNTSDISASHERQIAVGEHPGRL
jgi:hypothetical protein